MIQCANGKQQNVRLRMALTKSCEQRSGKVPNAGFLLRLDCGRPERGSREILWTKRREQAEKSAMEAAVPRGHFQSAHKVWILGPNKSGRHQVSDWLLWQEPLDRPPFSSITTSIASRVILEFRGSVSSLRSRVYGQGAAAWGWPVPIASFF